MGTLEETADWRQDARERKANEVPTRDLLEESHHSIGGETGGDQFKQSTTAAAWDVLGRKTCAWGMRSPVIQELLSAT